MGDARDVAGGQVIDVRPEEWATARATLADGDSVVCVDRTSRTPIYWSSTRGRVCDLNDFLTAHHARPALRWDPGAMALLHVEPSTHGCRAWLVIYTADHRAAVVGLPQIDLREGSPPTQRGTHDGQERIDEGN